MNTVEDTIQVLAGALPRPINIRLDTADIKLITSLSKQLLRHIALTDRQLDLSLKKIEKYRSSLEQCQVDVTAVLTLKTLKWPLRVIDRSQHIWIEQHADTKKTQILVKYVFSKKFAEIWSKIEEHTDTFGQGDKSIKKISYTERNLYHVVKGLRAMQFTSSDEVLEIYEKLEKILENPDLFVPCLNFEHNIVSVTNANARCQDALNSKFPQVVDADLPAFVNHAKILGILKKSPNLLKKINSLPHSSLTKKICLENSTRYRLSPDIHSTESLFLSIDQLNQWPVVVAVEENTQVFSVVRDMIDDLQKFIPLDKINVFFRLKNEQTDSQQFNQYVKDNHLNNYIDETTKVVFILRTRIPKPLLKSTWQPTSAVVASNHDFGRLSAYLNDFSSVYYYNNSITMRTSKLKGADKIVQL